VCVRACVRAHVGVCVCMHARVCMRVRAHARARVCAHGRVRVHVRVCEPPLLLWITVHIITPPLPPVPYCISTSVTLFVMTCLK